MKKYKINRNKKGLPEDRINSHKDFNKLLDNYQHIYNQKQANRPLYKKPGFLGFIMLVLVVTFVIVTVTDEEEKWIKNKEKAKTEKTVATESEKTESAGENSSTSLTKDTIAVQTFNNQIKAQKAETQKEVGQTTSALSFTIDPTRGSIIYLKNGHRIIVPSKAFVNAVGEPIKETVTLNFEEFLSREEITTSKTPSGNNLVSVFIIKGSNRKTRVYISAKNPLIIEQIYDSGKEFKLYHLEKTQWKEKSTAHSFARFTIGNDNGGSLFPPFKELVWEMKQEDFIKNSYLFNKSWRDLKLEEYGDARMVLYLYGTKTSTQIPFSFAQLVQEEAGNQKLLMSKFLIYIKGKSANKKDPGYIEAKKREKAWNMSVSDNTYFTWATSPEIKSSLNSNKATIKSNITEFGTWAVGKEGNSKVLNNSPRVINYNSTDNDRTFYKKGDQEITNDYKIKN